MKVTTRNSPFGAGDHLVVRIGDDSASAIPANIFFAVEDLPWEVEGIISIHPSTDVDEMRPDVTEVTIRQRPGGRALSSDMIRGVKLAAVRDEAVRCASTPMRRVGDAFVPESMWDAPVDPRTSRLARVKRKPERGARISDDTIRQTLATYREVIGDGLTNRYEATAERLHVSVATVGRHIDLAKKRGLIDEESSK